MTSPSDKLHFQLLGKEHKQEIKKDYLLWYDKTIGIGEIVLLEIEEKCDKTSDITITFPFSIGNLCLSMFGSEAQKDDCLVSTATVVNMKTFKINTKLILNITNKKAQELKITFKKHKNS